MKFESSIKLTKADVEKIILEHLRARGKPAGAKYHSVYFNVDGGGRGDYGEWDPARLINAEVRVELEVE